MAIVHQLAVFNAPMFPHVGGPLGVRGRALGFGQRKPFPVIKCITAAPAGEVLAVEQCDESRWRFARRQHAIREN